MLAFLSGRWLNLTKKQKQTKKTSTCTRFPILFICFPRPTSVSFPREVRLCYEPCFTLRQCCSWFLSFSRLLLPSLSATGWLHFLVSLVFFPKQKLCLARFVLRFCFCIVVFRRSKREDSFLIQTVAFSLSSLPTFICFRDFDLK